VPGWAHPQLQQAPSAQPPPYGWAPYPQAWLPPQQSKKTNALAIASLVTGVLALVPVAIGLAIAALVQIRKRDEKGSGLAYGGIGASLGWLLLIAGVALLAMSNVFSYTREGDLKDIASQEIGTCVNEVPSEVADCSTPHDFEVYYTGSVPNPQWPGEHDLDNTADDICYEAFEGYVGASYEDSDYDYAFFAPSEAEWRQGQHVIVCVVTPLGEYLVGTVKGSGD
jgi:hypothetical protein